MLILQLLLGRRGVGIVHDLCEYRFAHAVHFPHGRAHTVDRQAQFVLGILLIADGQYGHSDLLQFHRMLPPFIVVFY